MVADQRKIVNRISSDTRRTAPATRLRAIERPSEDGPVDVPHGATLYVGTPGNLKVVAAFGTTPVILKNVPLGPLDFCSIAQIIFDDDTTATDLVACW